MRALNGVLWSGLFGGLFGACYSPNPPLGAPCSASHECPDGQECDLLTNVCGYPTESRTLRDDTAAQFEGGALDQAWIEPGGFVGPIPYFINGVRSTGIVGNRLAAGIDAVTFEELEQLPAAGRGVLRGVILDFSDNVPGLLGFTSGDDITLLVDGEIFLGEVGTYTFELSANDLGFLDLAAPGQGFARITTADVANTRTMTYAVTSAGWHRIRGAFADTMQQLWWELRYRPPGQAGFRVIPNDDVRCSVAGVDGAIFDGFDEPFAASYSTSGIVDKLDSLVFTGPPYGAAHLGGGSYSVRWTAQFLVDMPGSYRFRIDTGQGQRAWIDGAQVANAYNSTAQLTTTSPITLDAGWHDLVIDAVKTGGPMGRFSFTVVDGPQFAGAGFPPDHLRPVAGRTARFATGTNSPFVDMVDGATVTRGVGVDLPTGNTALAIDASFSIGHPLLTQASVVLDPLVGSNVTLLAAATLTGMGNHEQHDAIPVDRSSGSFAFIAGDATVDTMIGTLNWITVTTTYTGGREPYEEKFAYTSTVREIVAARLGPLSWQMRQSMSEPVVSVRTCDDETACDAEPWTTVTNGETPAAPARRYIQYKVEAVTDGNKPASLDWIELEYVGYIEP